MVKLAIKWGKQKFDVDLDNDEALLDLKAKVYALTLVPIEKQKLIFKGSVLKDDSNISSLKLENGSVLMLMGAAEGVQNLESKIQKTVFVEDLTPEEKAKILKEKTGIIVPSGLINLGNTCYLNSSIQCLKRVNELKDFILTAKLNTNTMEGKIGFSFQSLLKLLEKKGESFEPYDFVDKFMTAFPMFAERTKEGVYQQQDADECFQNLLQTFERIAITKDIEENPINLIKKLFEIEFEEKLQNLEIESEPIQKKKDFTKKLVCIIDNQGNPINHLDEGIKANLEEKIEKISEIDGQNHIYKKTSQINKLPNYLIVQMMRFFWKNSTGLPGSNASKAKILRNVSFPKILDLFPHCTDSLKENLEKGRSYEKKKQEEQAQQAIDRFELYKKNLEKAGKIIPEDSREVYKNYKESLKEEEIRKHDELLYNPHGFGLETGNYQLIAVLTHKGRTADSGHYVSWIHRSGDDWYKYDDELVTEVKIEDVLNLRGGGDWHMAYYCIYRKIEIM